MAIPAVVESVVPQAAQKVETIRSSLEQYFAAHPELDGSPGVRMSTDVVKFEPSMLKLYELAFSRGDWLGTEFSPTGQLTLTPGIFANDARALSNLWVIFHDEKGRVLGATKLEINPVSGTLIDETQLDPIHGRGKGIMTNYFHSVVPIFEALKLRFRTEFVLTPESKVLRETLIGELGMKPTGIRPSCYVSQHASDARSALVAYGPGPSVDAALERCMRGAASVFQPLLDVIGRGHQPGLTAAPACEPASTYTEAPVRLADHELAANFARRGFVPVSFDPFADTFTMARIPHEEALYERLSFVLNESVAVASSLVEYVSRIAEGQRYREEHDQGSLRTSPARR